MEEPRCKSGDKIKSIHLIDLSDFVLKDGVIIRKKRKYGKFTRPVYSADWGTEEANKLMEVMINAQNDKENT